MLTTKICNKCNKAKSVDEFYNQKGGKNGKNSQCKECKKKYDQEHRVEISKQHKKYCEEHKDKLRQKAGYQSMYKNKLCSLYLGIVIGERLCRHLFKDVKVMPHGNTGYDIVCNKGKKIDVKTACVTLNNGKYPCWGFNIKRNKIADYFILVAFDNVEDLNPLHIWMIPGCILNKNSGTSISPSTIHRWSQWERDIEDAQICCTEIKNETDGD